MLGEVEHQDGAHAVIGEALPHLGEEQHEQAARMAQKGLGVGWNAAARIRTRHSVTPSGVSAGQGSGKVGPVHMAGANLSAAPCSTTAPPRCRCSPPAARASRATWSRRGRARTSSTTMLAIAARTPDHGKLAPWRFVVVEDDRRERVRGAAGGRVPRREARRAAGRARGGGAVRAPGAGAGRRAVVARSSSKIPLLGAGAVGGRGVHEPAPCGACAWASRAGG